MQHQFECESPADAEKRVAAAIRRGITLFGDDHRRDRVDELAIEVLAGYIVDQLVEDGFLPAEPHRPGPFQAMR